MEKTADKLVNNESTWTKEWELELSFVVENVLSDTSTLFNNVMEVSSCPNCWKDLIEWACQDIELCGYWYWDKFTDSIFEEELIEITSKEYIKYEKWLSHEIIWMWIPSNIEYFENLSKIKENSWIIFFSDKWQKYKVIFSYTKNKFTNFVDNDWNEQVTYEINLEKQKNHKCLVTKKMDSWKLQDIHYDYHTAKSIIIAILSDKRFNKTV